MSVRLRPPPLIFALGRPYESNGCPLDAVRDEALVREYTGPCWYNALDLFPWRRGVVTRWKDDAATVLDLEMAQHAGWPPMMSDDGLLGSASFTVVGLRPDCVAIDPACETGRAYLWSRGLVPWAPNIGIDNRIYDMAAIVDTVGPIGWAVLAVTRAVPADTARRDAADRLLHELNEPHDPARCSLCAAPTGYEYARNYRIGWWWVDNDGRRTKDGWFGYADSIDRGCAVVERAFSNRDLVTP